LDVADTDISMLTLECGVFIIRTLFFNKSTTPTTPLSRVKARLFWFVLIDI